MKKNTKITVRVATNLNNEMLEKAFLQCLGTEGIYEMSQNAYAFGEFMLSTTPSDKETLREVASIMKFDNLSYIIPLANSSLAQELYLGKFDNNFTIRRGIKAYGAAYQVLSMDKNYERNLYALKFETNVPLAYSFYEYVEEMPVLRLIGSSIQGTTTLTAAGRKCYDLEFDRLYFQVQGISSLFNAYLLSSYDNKPLELYASYSTQYLKLVQKIREAIMSDCKESRDYTTSLAERGKSVGYSLAALTILANQFIGCYYAPIYQDYESTNKRDVLMLDLMSLKHISNLSKQDLGEDVVYDEHAFLLYLFGSYSDQDALYNAVIESLHKLDSNLYEATIKLISSFNAEVSGGYHDDKDTK